MLFILDHTSRLVSSPLVRVWAKGAQRKKSIYFRVELSDKYDVYDMFDIIWWQTGGEIVVFSHKNRCIIWTHILWYFTKWCSRIGTSKWFRYTFDTANYYMKNNIILSYLHQSSMWLYWFHVKTCVYNRCVTIFQTNSIFSIIYTVKYNLKSKLSIMNAELIISFWAAAFSLSGIKPKQYTNKSKYDEKALKAGGGDKIWLLANVWKWRYANGLWSWYVFLEFGSKCKMA